MAGRSISISEIGQFMRCRRAWDLQSPFRQNLTRMGVPSAALHIGAGVHEGLEANALGNDWRAAVAQWLEDDVKSFTEYYTEQVGAAPSAEELSTYDEAFTMVNQILERYFTRYSEDRPLGDNFTYLAVEQTCAVPIPDTDGTFTFTIDGLARDNRTDALWVVEHKTYSSKPDMDRLSTDPQITAYGWAIAAILGEPIAGFLYDGVAKKAPAQPALLKSGRLSEAYTETIDSQSYMDAIVRHELDPNDYADMLARLTERDQQPQTPFFTRWRIPVLQTQVDSFASYIGMIYNDMVNNPAIYPNFRFDGCWDCSVRDMCKAIQFKDDVEWLQRTYYIQGRGSQSFQRRKGTPTIVDANVLRSMVKA